MEVERRRGGERWTTKRVGGRAAAASCTRSSPQGRRIDPEAAAAVIRPLIKCQSPTPASFYSIYLYKSTFSLTPCNHLRRSAFPLPAHTQIDKCLRARNNTGGLRSFSLVAEFSIWWGCDRDGRKKMRVLRGVGLWSWLNVSINLWVNWECSLVNL